MSVRNVPPLAVSVGEPAGVGPDIVLQAWSEFRDGHLDDLPPFLLIADPGFLAARADFLEVGVDLEIIEDGKESTAACSANSFGKRLPVLRLDNKLNGRPARPTSQDAKGIVESIDHCVDLIKSGHARAITTLPINKKSLYDAGFDHPGHTEYLGSLAKDWPNSVRPCKPVMMLAGPELRTVPVTIHIPLKDVSTSLTQELIVETGVIVAHDLQTQFGIAAPRLALAGLNPHAGEGGALGSEDAETIAPAIEDLRKRGIDARGPLPADTMFHAAARSRYDVALCMYHDQALIPAKALAFDESVNVTLGLPFVRTSPDHGTAFDIAGTGKANISSFVAALRMADQMTALST